MSKIFKFFLICCYVFIPVYAFATDCSKYKYDVDINVNNITKYEPVIQSSKENMIGKMGEILYQLSYSLKIFMIQIPVKDGYCVSLRSVDIDINVPEFLINIDKRLKPDTCAYNIVLKHEQDHMNVNKTVINSNIDRIKQAVINAVDSIKPVFISKIEDSGDIQINIQNEIENYKDVKDIKKKIKSEMNNANEEIDTRGDSFEMWKCEDFYNEMKKYSDKIRID